MLRNIQPWRRRKTFATRARIATRRYPEAVRIGVTVVLVAAAEVDHARSIVCVHVRMEVRGASVVAAMYRRHAAIGHARLSGAGIVVEHPWDHAARGAPGPVQRRQRVMLIRNMAINAWHILQSCVAEEALPFAGHVFSIVEADAAWVLQARFRACHFVRDHEESRQSVVLAERRQLTERQAERAPESPDRFVHA